jgi:predicted outer membrane repeat protein
VEALEGRWAPAVLTVNSVADNTNSDNSLTLREAIMLVDGNLGRSLSSAEQAQVVGTLGSSDTIQFNLPAGAQTITLTRGALAITKPMSIVGPGAGTLTINGNNADRIFAVGTSDNLSLVAAISGLTITNGNARSSSIDHYGGGLVNFGTLTVSNCVFANNTAPAGGAISSEGTLTLNNCTLSGNYGTSDGGAIYNYHGIGILTVNNSTFLNNTTGADGGGIRSNLQMVLNGCTFTGNVASSQGGGLSTSDTKATVTNCTFTNNSAGSDGGGIEIESGTRTATFVNDTITGNLVRTSSSGVGGGVRSDFSATFENTLVAGNFRGSGSTADDVGGSLSSSSSYNLIGTGGSGGLRNGNNNNQVGITNPGLGVLSSNGGPTQTIPLLPGSPAIDHGSNAFVTPGETDQRGLPRVVNGAVDIGAYEVQGQAVSSFTVTGLPTSIQAGTAGTITVTALTASGATATSYTGTVHFTSSDAQAVLPANYTFVSGDNGVHTFSVTLKTAGSQAVTVTDTVTVSSTGTQSGVTVTPAAATILAVAGFPSTTTAGVAGMFTVTAHDAFGNTATGYTGTVHLTSSDAQALLPANYTFVAADNGVHSFGATLRTAGSQSITATDTTTGITGVHAAITVNPASASNLTLTGYPSPTLAGAAGSFTVTASDSFGNYATGYLGTVHFTSTDPSALLPADYTFVAGDHGTHTFSTTFKTTGTQSLSAADKAAVSITGTQAAITVNPAAFSTLQVVGFPSPTTAGVAGAFTVSAVDSLGNILTSYTGSVHFTSSDAQAVLPADYTFVAADNGVHTFSAILKTAGSQTISVRDASAGVVGVHSAITVIPANASSFTVTGFPSPTQVGVSGSFTVTAEDPFGNIATGYLGAIHFTSSDAKAILPADYAFVAADRGIHTFNATFETAGAQTLTAADTMAPSIAGTHSAITVNPAPSGPVLLVNSTADNTTADNFLTLREAIAVVDGTLGRALTAGEQAQISGTLGANDTIAFNLPAGPQTITLTGGALDITQPVAISGSGAANLTINGNNADRVFIIGHNWSSANLSLVVKISGVTITGGAQAYGAGLLNFGALTVSNTTFANNTAGTSGGGGLYNVGAVTLNSCAFTGNTVTASSAGGGIENYSSGTAAINNCTFTNNSASGSGSSASSGGAIGNSGAMTITGSTFTGNTAASDGGAIYSDGALTISTTSFLNSVCGSDGGAIRSQGTSSISACTFAGNTAASVGGGLDTSDASANVTNSTFANNTAGSGGGGAFCESNNAVFINCTITANRVNSTSSSVGAGLMADGTLTIQNTIVAGNFRGASGTTADDVAAALTSNSSYNLIGIGGAGGLVNGVNHNQVGVTNLDLGALANNGGPTMTIALLAGSPAIDSGNNSFVVAGETDQRGQARIHDGTVDIGAFES